MEVFEKEIESEKNERMPKIEEGKEATDEQKKEMEKIQAELNMKKIKQFETFIKEAQTFKYNTNVFKNVKLALS